MVNRSLLLVHGYRLREIPGDYIPAHRTFGFRKKSEKLQAILRLRTLQTSLITCIISVALFVNEAMEESLRRNSQGVAGGDFSLFMIR